MNETSAETGNRGREIYQFGPLFISILDGVFDFYGTLNKESEVITLSGRIFERTHTDPSKLVGQKFHETVFWQSYEVTPQVLQKALDVAAGGEGSKIILDFRVNADEKVAVELTIQPLETVSDNAMTFIGGKVVPNAERAPGIGKENEQLLLAADNADIGLWYWDLKDDTIYSNAACNDLLNISTHESLTRSSFLASVHPDDRSAVEVFLEESRQNGTKFEEEFRVIYSDESLEWICVEGKGFASEGERLPRILGVARKITEQKRSAEDLAQVHDREKRARDEAVAASRSKDFFLAFVSHELRSPLNAILGWAKILLTRQVDDETRKNALETIEKSARFQTKLIDDLVDSARVASGKLKLEYRPANLYEIVNASFQAQTPAAASHQIEFTFVSDIDQIPIYGDAGRLQQVFGNLLSNALKFTPDGGSIAIDIHTTRDTAVVAVSDSGQGIERELLPNIFQQFAQGDISEVKRNTGLGLGLSIVNVLVEKHGGSVQAESAGLGKGSTFTVVLPLSMAKSTGFKSSEPVVNANPQPLTGIKVLIVEDDNDSREVVQLFLEQSGAVVQSTESAKSAMQLLTQNTGLPDIIVSDLAMPDEDGYTLVSKIRKLPPEAGGTIPALALSAFATSESKQRALESGFTRYLTKPFEPDLLIAEILKAAGGK